MPMGVDTDTYLSRMSERGNLVISSLAFHVFSSYLTFSSFLDTPSINPAKTSLSLKPHPFTHWWNKISSQILKDLLFDSKYSTLS